MGIILGILFFFGLGLLALIILTVSAFCSRTVTAVLSWAGIAIGLMVLQCLLLTYMAGIGSATNGSQDGYRMVTIALGVFAVSLPLYFVVALGRVRKKNDTQ
jgi:hypothetical protein